MKRSTRNKAKGSAKELKGRIKEKTGRATHSRDMEDEGTLERAEGKTQRKIGEIEDVLED